MAAAGCRSISVQAGAALALAAAVAFAQAWHRLTPIGRIAVVVILGIGAWRVTGLEKAVDYTAYDLRYLMGAGGMTREQYLSRFGERASDDKYSALAVRRTGAASRYRRGDAGARAAVRVLAGRAGAVASDQCVALFLEPADHRRLQQRQARVWRRRSPGRTRAHASGRSDPAASRLGIRARFGVVFSRRSEAGGVAGRDITSPPASWATICCIAANRSWRDADAARTFAAALARRSDAARDRRCAVAFPAADPPWRTHRRRRLARRRRLGAQRAQPALFGAWRLDAWNPMFIAPVFTGARVRRVRDLRRRRPAGPPRVRSWPALASVLLLALGVARIGGRRAGADRRRAAGDQLRLRDVEPRRDHGSHDGRRSSWSPGTATPGRSVSRALGLGRRRSARCSRSSPRPPRPSSWRRSRSTLRRGRGSNRGAASVSGGAGAPRAWHACGPRRLRARRARGVRAAALDRLSVLQLADVGDAEAVVRPQVADRSRDLVPDPPRFLHADVVRVRGRR